MIRKLGQTLGQVRGRLVEGHRTSGGQPVVALNTERFPLESPRADHDNVLVTRNDADSPWTPVPSVAEFKKILEKCGGENVGVWQDRSRWLIGSGDGLVQEREVTALTDLLSKPLRTFDTETVPSDDLESVIHSAQANLAGALLVQSLEVASVQSGSTYEASSLQIPYLCDQTTVTQIVYRKSTEGRDWGLVGKTQRVIHEWATTETKNYTVEQPQGDQGTRKTWKIVRDH